MPLKLSPIAIIEHWMSPLGDEAANRYVKPSSSCLASAVNTHTKESVRLMAEHVTLQAFQTNI